MRLKLRFRDTLRFTMIVDMLTRRGEFETFPLVVGDTLPTLDFFLIDENGDPYDLTGSSVDFFFRKFGLTTHKNVATSCSITNPTEGECRYEWGDGDIDEPGLHLGELQITSPAEKKLTLPYEIRFEVRKQIEGVS